MSSPDLSLTYRNPPLEIQFCGLGSVPTVRRKVLGLANALHILVFISTFPERRFEKM